MSAHHAPDWVPHREGHGLKNDGVLTTWLSLISFTFFIGTFVAASIYLQMWSPENFKVELGTDLPNVATLILLVMGVVSIAAGNLFRKGSWKAFQLTMMLNTLVFIAYAVVMLKLMGEVHALGAAAWTTYLGIYIFQFILAIVNLFFVGKIGILFSERNVKALNSWVPSAMAVFLYTAVIGVVIFLLTGVVEFGEFAEWCGKRIGVLQ